MRAKRDGFVRNVCVALGNAGNADDVPAIVTALDDPSPLVRGHAAWALSRMFERAVLGPEQVAWAEAALEIRLALEQDDFAREEMELALQRFRAM